MKKRTPPGRPLAGIAKCPTGIRGLDELTVGGLPRGRPALVCGGAGCGKTLLAVEFIVRGARDFNEPGVFLAFEESVREISDNVASLGFDMMDLVRRKKLAAEHVRVERSEITETGEYDLEGLFIRLDAAIKAIGARRVVLDGIEALFAGLSNEAIVRAELRRLFLWLKEQGVTTIITAEQGDRTFTRHGLEEYVSDCVVFMDHRVANQVATRRLRIVKYRGSAHGTNEYPMLIDEQGFKVLPISSLGLAYPVSNRRVSTGIARLDTMLGGKGYYRGSSVLVSGASGSGKSSFAALFAHGFCGRGERCLYWSSEESPEQIIRNMASIGVPLARHKKSGLLRFHSVRPTIYGLEAHLVTLHKLVSEFRPAAVVMEPITNLLSIGSHAEIKAMLSRAIDHLKGEGITALFTSLTAGGDGDQEDAELGITSLMDTWLLLQVVKSASERNRLLYILKSRGMEHSNQMREFVLGPRGVDLLDVYTGPGVVYTGSARIAQQALVQAADWERKQVATLHERELVRQRQVLEAEIGALRARLEGVEGERRLALDRDRQFAAATFHNQASQALSRQADRKEATR
jgi:circadian clock protein KaiC